MGDAADGLLDGIFDEETGEYIDDDISASGGCGFPRSLQREGREFSNRHKKDKSEHTRQDKINGVMNFMRRNFSAKDEDSHKAIKDYAQANGFLSEESPVANACVEIQNDFGKFVQHIKKINK